MAESFLTSLFPSVRLRWRLEGVAVSGGQPLSGPPDTAETTCGGYWSCETTIKRLSREREVRQWTAFLGRLENGSVPIIVPHVGVGNPWPEGYRGLTRGVPHSDNAPFSDGSLYQSQLIVYKLVDAVEARAREMRLRRVFGSNLMGGEFFTLTGSNYGPRLHFVSQVKDISDDIFTVRIGNPPLREGYSAGIKADFQKPCCLMKVDVESLEDAWMEIERPYRGQPRITFKETGDGV